MKSIYKIFMLAGVLFLASCELTELDLNTDPNSVAPETAELEFLFNKMQFEFSNFAWEASDETMPITRMMAMTGGNIYDNQDSPQSFNFLWNRAYSEVLPDADIVISNANESSLFVHSGIAKVMKAYILMVLVDCFGDVPYSEAVQGLGFQNPNRDSDEAVYEEARLLLVSAMEDFGKESLGTPGNDIIYGGSAAQWTKAASSLMLRYHITTRLVNNNGTAVQSLIDGGNLIADAADDFQFQYGTNRSTPDSRHPHYSTDYEVDADYYQSNYYMWSLLDEKGIQDPRLRYYFYRQDCDTTDEDQFTLDCPEVPRPPHYTGDYPWCVASEEGWWGREHGNNDGIPPDGLKRTTFGVYPAGGNYDNDNCAGVAGDGSDGLQGAGIIPIMMSSFVDFMRAEAALTMGTSDDAGAMLESGVRKSISKVLAFGAGLAGDNAPGETAVEDYVSLVMGSFNGAGSNDEKLAIVCKEYHIALWGNGVEAYNMYRRTGYPSGMQPTREPDSGTFPRLMWYPQDHITLNANADQRDLNEQVFWDTNPANPGWIN